MKKRTAIASMSAALMLMVSAWSANACESSEHN